MNDTLDHDAMLDLVAVHALGALGSDEARAVSVHLVTCSDCRAEYAELRPAATSIAFMADDAIDEVSSRRMKKRLLAAIEPEARHRSNRSVAGWRIGFVAAAAAAAVLGFTTYSGQLRASESDAKLTQTQNELDRERTIVADLDFSGAQRYSVPGGDVLKTRERVVLVMRSMPALPKGKVYQAWTLAPGAKNVSPSITFVPNSHGKVVVSLPEAAPDVAAVAVSIEPPGGSKAPTTKPSFVRPLS